MYAFRNVARLEQKIESGETGAKAPAAKAAIIPKAPKLSLYPLTPSQPKPVFSITIGSTSLAYNMPGVFQFGKQPDLSRLKAALRELVQEEELFRTAFVMEDRKIGQR